MAGWWERITSELKKRTPQIWDCQFYNGGFKHNSPKQTFNDCALKDFRLVMGQYQRSWGGGWMKKDPGRFGVADFTMTVLNIKV